MEIKWNLPFKGRAVYSSNGLSRPEADTVRDMVTQRCGEAFPRLISMRPIRWDLGRAGEGVGLIWADRVIRSQEGDSGTDESPGCIQT